MAVKSQSQLSDISVSARFDEPSLPLTEDRLAVLGHEIRNPLSALSYALQAWPESSDDRRPEQVLQSQLLQIMRRQVLQMTRLCNDLLDTGRIARGNLEISKDLVDVRQVIYNACEQIRPFIEQSGHEFSVTLGDLPVKIVGDESRLTQVLVNMMHNSAKFTERGGHLHILLEKDVNIATISIHDNGRGICADRLRTIFSSNEESRKYVDVADGGLGIGLRLAKSIVDLHGGSINVFSKGLRLGSTFVVKLPLAVDRSTMFGDVLSRSSDSVVISGPILPSYRIVAVDDKMTSCFFDVANA